MPEQSGEACKIRYVVPRKVNCSYTLFSLDRWVSA